ncbi:hypothetical protein ABIF78_007664 [Bradyrhizobium japonicum]
MDVYQTKETADLARLSVERVRYAVMLAGQLIEDDEQRASILITCAVDLINGAASLLEQDGKVSPHAAMTTAVLSVMSAVDDAKVQAAMATLLTKRKKP